jgi:thiamine phosphate synthase YjbQ (UPF0047 family)
MSAIAVRFTRPRESIERAVSCLSKQVPKKGDYPHRDYSNVIYMNGGEHLHSILIHLRRHNIACKSAFVEEMP